MATQLHQIPTKGLLTIYAKQREELLEEQANWKKPLSAIVVLHLINSLAIIGALIFGYYRATSLYDDFPEIIFIMAVVLVFTLAGIFVFTILWKIVFFFIRLSMEKSLDSLDRRLNDILQIKKVVISRLSLNSAVAEKNPHLDTKFSNSVGRWQHAEREIYNQQRVLLELQLDKMRSTEWQWIKYSFMVAVWIIAAIIAVMLFIIAIILALVAAYLSSPKDNYYQTYDDRIDDFEEKLTRKGPSRHEILLQTIEAQESKIVKLQEYAEKVKDDLSKWGAPESSLFRNEQPIVFAGKQPKKVKE